MNIIRKNKLEEILIANWAHFADTTRLMSYVLGIARDETFSVNKVAGVKTRPPQVKVSRFEPQPGGFAVWVEFTAPRDGGQVVGTTELFVRPDGEAEHVQTVGQLLVNV